MTNLFPRPPISEFPLSHLSFPALHKCFPFEMPRVRGGIKLRQDLASRKPTCISELSISPRSNETFEHRVVFQDTNRPSIRDSASRCNTNPGINHGAERRPPPSSDGRRPLGRQSCYRDWYATLSHSPPHHPSNLSAKQAPRPASASQPPTSSSPRAAKSSPRTSTRTASPSTSPPTTSPTTSRPSPAPSPTPPSGRRSSIPPKRSSAASTS